MITLGRWLGPWASERDVAPNVHRSEVDCQDSDDASTPAVRAYLYEPTRKKVRGAYLIAPGLHYQGPDDPRLDRFCRALAASGLVVMSPFLPAFLDLTVSPVSGDHLTLAFDALERQVRREALPPPTVFAISFGTAPALDLASRPTHADRVGAVVLFGGFCDFRASVEFAVTGVAVHEGEEHELPRDPLNAPVIYRNILDHLDVPGAEDPRHRALLLDAWRDMVTSTWGRMELKAPGARDPIAEGIAERLPESLRSVFMMGCGLGPGGPEVVRRALDASGDAFAWMDARPRLAGVKAPLIVVHGRDDDVIPHFEALKLVAAMPPGHPHRAHFTGLYGHTGAGMPKLREVVQEARTMIRMLRDMVDAPLGQLKF